MARDRNKEPLSTTVHFAPDLPKGEQPHGEVVAKTRARELYDALSPDDKNRVGAYFSDPEGRFNMMTGEVREEETVAWDADDIAKAISILESLASADPQDMREKNRLAQQFGSL